MWNTHVVFTVHISNEALEGIHGKHAGQDKLGYSIPGFYMHEHHIFFVCLYLFS